MKLELYKEIVDNFYGKIFFKKEAKFLDDRSNNYLDKSVRTIISKCKNIKDSVRDILKITILNK